MRRQELLRFERGLTSTEVAKGAGISRPTLSAFERGDDVSAPTAKALADFYEITVAELLGVQTEREIA